MLQMRRTRKLNPSDQFGSTLLPPIVTRPEAIPNEREGCVDIEEHCKYQTAALFARSRESEVIE
jgi:hypothetical protein